MPPVVPAVFAACQSVAHALRRWSAASCLGERGALTFAVPGAAVAAAAGAAGAAVVVVAGAAAIGAAFTLRARLGAAAVDVVGGTGEMPVVVVEAGVCAEANTGAAINASAIRDVRRVTKTLLTETERAVIAARR